MSPTEQEEEKKKKKVKKKVWSVHTGEHRAPGNAHVTGLDAPSVGVCARVCVYVCVGWKGGTVSVFGQMCDPQQLCPPTPPPSLTVSSLISTISITVSASVVYDPRRRVPPPP